MEGMDGGNGWREWMEGGNAIHVHRVLFLPELFGRKEGLWEKKGRGHFFSIFRNTNVAVLSRFYLRRGGAA